MTSISTRLRAIGKFRSGGVLACRASILRDFGELLASGTQCVPIVDVYPPSSALLCSFEDSLVIGDTVTAESIFDGVYQVGPGYVNSFIVDGDEGVVLVDTLLPGKAEMIGEGLREIGRSFEDVRAILVTHSHADHSGSAAAVKAESRAPLYASEADAPAIQGVVKPPASPTPFYVKPLAVLMSLMPGPPAAEVDHFVSEASEPSLPGDLRAVDTPGHTPGHTSFLLDRGAGVLFVGDAAKATKDGKVVRGYFNRSTPVIDRSLSHLAELVFETAAFGHSDPIKTEASSAFRRFAGSLQ